MYLALLGGNITRKTSISNEIYDCWVVFFVLFLFLLDISFHFISLHFTLPILLWVLFSIVLVYLFYTIFSLYLTKWFLLKFYYILRKREPIKARKEKIYNLLTLWVFCKVGECISSIFSLLCSNGLLEFFDGRMKGWKNEYVVFSGWINRSIEYHNRVQQQANPKGLLKKKKPPPLPPPSVHQSYYWIGTHNWKTIYQRPLMWVEFSWIVCFSWLRFFFWLK